MTYLSVRKRTNRPETLLFYAITAYWDKKEKIQKRHQHYLGSKKGSVYRFNEKARDYAQLFHATDHEMAYWNWRKDVDANEKKENICTEASVGGSDERACGLDLVFSKIVRDCGLKDHLNKVFGSELTDDILTLAYYCASQDSAPLYCADVWSRDQVLPREGSLSQADIAQILNTISPSKCLDFLSSWLKTVDPQDRLSLDITSVSSYSTRNYDVKYGYNRDGESLPQINLLMMVSQTTKLPIWYEQLPGAIADITTLKDTTRLLRQTGCTLPKLVLDKGFASKSNIVALLKGRFKFTMGIPLYRFSQYRKMAREAYQNNEFIDPQNTLDLFEPDDTLQTQATTRVLKIEGHRVYLHLFYTDYYKSNQLACLMSSLKEIEQQLKNGDRISNPIHEQLAERCFTVKRTPKRGRKVITNTEEIAKLRDSDAGFFAIMSNQFKDAEQALVAYKLRDGIEKRFDDLKNDTDLRRLRMHSPRTQRARLFIQFIAEILRCKILHIIQNSDDVPSYAKVVTSLLREMASIKRVKMPGHRFFYKRPTKHQLKIMDILGISRNPNMWPSLF